MPQNLSRITSGTKAPFYSALPRHKPYLPIALSLPIPKNFAGTTRKVNAIRIVAIAAPAALGFRVLPWPLGSKRLRPQLETIVIIAATGQRDGKIGT